MDAPDALRNDQIQSVGWENGIADPADVYLSGIHPGQVYAIYLSYRDGSIPDWSPWGRPFLASTAVTAYAWIHPPESADWLIHPDASGRADKITDSSTPLYSSFAQFFAGCRITFTVSHPVMRMHSSGLKKKKNFTKFLIFSKNFTKFLFF